MREALCAPADAARAVVARCLSPAAADRYACGAELLAAWRAATAAEEADAARLRDDDDAGNGGGGGGAAEPEPSDPGASGAGPEQPGENGALALHNLGVAFTEIGDYRRAVVAHDAGADALARGPTLAGAVEDPNHEARERARASEGRRESARERERGGGERTRTPRAPLSRGKNVPSLFG